MQAAAKAIQNYNHELWLKKKMHNLPSCAARQRQMNVACGWITNYTSSLARQPLWRMSMACDHNNTTQASYGTRTYDERNRADEASKFNIYIRQPKHVHNVLFIFR